MFAIIRNTTHARRNVAGDRYFFGTLTYLTRNQVMSPGMRNRRVSISIPFSPPFVARLKADVYFGFRGFLAFSGGLGGLGFFGTKSPPFIMVQVRYISLTRPSIQSPSRYPAFLYNPKLPDPVLQFWRSHLSMNGQR